MNRKFFISEVSKKAGFTQSDTKLLLNAMVEFFKETLVRGENIKIEGFLTAYVADMAPYIGYDPIHDTRIPIPARKRVVFRVSHVIDQAVNKAFAEESKTDE